MRPRYFLLANFSDDFRFSPFSSRSYVAKIVQTYISLCPRYRAYA